MVFKNDPEKNSRLFSAVTDPQAGADVQLPFLAGLLDGMLKNLFIPMVQPKKYVSPMEGSGPDMPTARLVLQNGDVIKISIEKV